MSRQNIHAGGVSATGCPCPGGSQPLQLLIAGALAPLVVVFLVASFRQPLKVALPVYAALLPFGSGLTTGLPSAFGSVSSLAGVVLTLALTGQLMTSRRGSSTLTSSLPVWLMF